MHIPLTVVATEREAMRVLRMKNCSSGHQAPAQETHFTEAEDISITVQVIYHLSQHRSHRTTHRSTLELKCRKLRRPTALRVQPTAQATSRIFPRHTKEVILRGNQVMAVSLPQVHMLRRRRILDHLSHPLYPLGRLSNHSVDVYLK